MASQVFKSVEIIQSHFQNSTPFFLTPKSKVRIIRNLVILCQRAESEGSQER